MRLNNAKLQGFGKGFLIGLSTILVFGAASFVLLTQPDANLGSFAMVLMFGVPALILVNLIILIFYSRKKQWWIVLGQIVALLIAVIFFYLYTYDWTRIGLSIATDYCIA